MRIQISHSLVSLIFVTAVGLQSQTAHPPPERVGANQSQMPVIHANTRSVVVDIVVTKGQDEPVLALKKQDFELLEDGKPQAIDFFEEHTTPLTGADKRVPIAPMPPHVYTNVPAAPPVDSVNILLLDTLNTPRYDQAFVRQQILNYLRTSKPDARIAIFVLGSRLSLIQGFTDDPTVLRAALNDKQAGFHTDKADVSRSREDDQADKDEIATRAANLGGQGRSTAGIEALTRSQADYVEYEADQRAVMSLDALQSLGRYLAGIPGRKNLIWFASQYPIYFFPHTGEKQPLNYHREFTTEIKHTADLLTLSKVAVYPMDAEGMMNDHPMDAEHNREQAGVGAGLLQNIMEGAGQRSTTISAMEQIASDTGGQAIFNNNDLNTAINHVIHNGAHYYTIVYTPASKQMDGQFRHIQIKLNQGKYKLAYRRGYYADDEKSQPGSAQSSTESTLTAQANSQPAPKTLADPLRPLMDRGMPSSTQILYGVRVLPAAQQPEPTTKPAGLNLKVVQPTTRYVADFLIDWKKVQLQPDANGKYIGEIRVELIAYDHDGKPLNWISQTMGMMFDAANYAAIQKSGIPAHLELDLPRTDIYLATGIFDLEANRAGTLEIPLPAEPKTIAESKPQ